MLKWISRYFLPFLLLTACQNRGPEAPENLIEQDKMYQMLLEIHMAEGKVDELVMTREQKQAYFNAYEHKIYEKYGVDSATYRQSYDYYMHDLGIMASFYQDLNDTIENMNRKANQN